MAYPVLSEEDICNCIDTIQYHLFENTTVTVCCINLVGGGFVTGESICRDVYNFNKENEQILALNDAKQKIYQLRTYALCVNKGLNN